MTDIEELKRLALLAIATTTGEWQYREEGITGGVWAGQEIVFGGDRCEGYLPPDDPNVLFAIAAQPSAILELIARLEAAEVEKMPEGYIAVPECAWHDMVQKEARKAETYQHIRDITKAAGYDNVGEALVALGKSKKDAERYRCLRTGEGFVWCGAGDDLLQGSALDAAIDAELAKEQG